MNVGYGLNEHQLRSHFSTYGKVLDVYLPKHKSGRNKGYGFASFEKEDGLLAALQVMPVPARHLSAWKPVACLLALGDVVLLADLYVLTAGAA